MTFIGAGVGLSGSILLHFFLGGGLLCQGSHNFIELGNGLTVSPSLTVRVFVPIHLSCVPSPTVVSMSKD